MKAIAINGSPRKSWNTVKLLQKALEGAASMGAETELIHLYSLNFKGCVSCFSCKRKDRKATGQCVIKDDLAKVLEQVMASDVLLLGSPIYLGNITGAMKSFMERLIFSNLSYDSPSPKNTVFAGKVSSGFIYTMGIPKDMLELCGYSYIFDSNTRYLQLLNGHSEYLLSMDNYQFDDYSKYAASNFDEKHKAAVRAEQFPMDCENAFQLGARLASLTV